jgi:16S rRNA (cytosine967-C5)-methyltransferase
MNDGAQSRAAAVHAICAVLDKGRRIESAIADFISHDLSGPDRAYAQALTFGVLRFGHRLQLTLMPLLARPWDSQASELKALLLIGVYQLEYAETPPHAAVNATVEAARLVGQGRAAGLINACLRRFQRERTELLRQADFSVAGRYSHPEWLSVAISRDWPELFETILASNNEHPPLTLRANARRITTEELADRLEARGLRVRMSTFAPRALVLEEPTDIRLLPEFQEGLCSVQDAVAQLAPLYLGVAPGMRVLDACAAPGGKTGHILEECPGLKEMVALDIDAARVSLIRSNLDRLGLAATLQVGDALDPTAFVGQRFERILLDAPCSGTGVIRRHPDIKWLRRPADIAQLVSRERKLLNAMWALLEPGGRLVYSTCSILRSENSSLVAQFLNDNSDAVDVTKSVGLEVQGLNALSQVADVGISIFPGISGTDGFYYACLERRTVSI